MTTHMLKKRTHAVETKAWTQDEWDRATSDLLAAVQGIDTTADNAMDQLEQLSEVLTTMQEDVEVEGADGGAAAYAIQAALGDIMTAIADKKREADAAQSGKSARRTSRKSDVAMLDLSTVDAVIATLTAAELGGELEPAELETVAGLIAEENPEIEATDLAAVERIYDAAVRRMLDDVEGADTEKSSRVAA